MAPEEEGKILTSLFDVVGPVSLGLAGEGVDGHATSGAGEEASGQDGSADAIPLGERTDVSRFSAHGCRVWRVSEAKDRGGVRVVGGRRGLAGSDPSSFFARWRAIACWAGRALCPSPSRPWLGRTFPLPTTNQPNPSPARLPSHLRPRPPSRSSSSHFRLSFAAAASRLTARASGSSLSSHPSRPEPRPTTHRVPALVSPCRASPGER